jgi:dihydroorotase-like cyclic amidohydrolase
MNEPLDLIFRAPRVITAAGEVARSIGVRDGRIVAIEQLDSALEADRIVELGTDEVLIPGLVDTHVHVNDPGRTEWEGFASATKAAAAGGVTTIVDMPLNSIPPTVDTDAFDIRNARPRPSRPTSMSGSGVVRYRATCRNCARYTTPACSGSNASCCTPGSTNSRR